MPERQQQFMIVEFRISQIGDSANLVEQVAIERGYAQRVCIGPELKERKGHLEAKPEVTEGRGFHNEGCTLAESADTVPIAANLLVMLGVLPERHNQPALLRDHEEEQAVDKE